MEVETFTSPLDTNFSQCYEQNILICTGNRASQDDFSIEHAFFFFLKLQPWRKTVFYHQNSDSSSLRLIWYNWTWLSSIMICLMFSFQTCQCQIKMLFLWHPFIP